MIRVTTPSGKIGTLIIGAVSAPLAGVLAGAAWGTVAAALASGATIIGTFAFCFRFFRGPSEDPEAPRAWWRTTERPTAGFVVAVVFVLQACIGGFMAGERSPAVGVTIGVTYALLAVLVALSALRLRKESPARRQG